MAPPPEEDDGDEKELEEDGGDEKELCERCCVLVERAE
eukprot:CAMPEP_0171878022 /NCGR_PEP_ID=MMETSP0992-20121227/37041_1 /TAXON_ID=483369 /ORGANISM="non described non described, Strain CCMP2098" /LENGTH=37 /DNA_ID= /DNA_START= /DNA_END= /DNA_ORIENTATION=